MTDLETSLSKKPVTSLENFMDDAELVDHQSESTSVKSVALENVSKAPEVLDCPKKSEMKVPEIKAPEVKTEAEIVASLADREITLVCKGFPPAGGYGRYDGMTFTRDVPLSAMLTRRSQVLTEILKKNPSKHQAVKLTDICYMDVERWRDYCLKKPFHTSEYSVLAELFQCHAEEKKAFEMEFAQILIRGNVIAHVKEVCNSFFAVAKIGKNTLVTSIDVKYLDHLKETGLSEYLPKKPIQRLHDVMFAEKVANDVFCKYVDYNKDELVCSLRKMCFSEESYLCFKVEVTGLATVKLSFQKVRRFDPTIADLAGKMTSKPIDASSVADKLIKDTA